MNNECYICGEIDKYKYEQRLCCGHIYHYECIMKTFICDNDTSFGKKKNNNYCPYCSKESGLLPVINNLPKIIKGIHYSLHEKKPEVDKILCQGIILSGKKKGMICNRNCILGYNYCKLHKKNIYSIYYLLTHTFNSLNEIIEIIEIIEFKLLYTLNTHAQSMRLNNSFFTCIDSHQATPFS